MNSDPLNAAAALSASAASISTNPNPLDLPVILSVMTLASSTFPNLANACLRSLSVAFQDKFPQYSTFVANVLCPVGIARDTSRRSDEVDISWF